MARLIAIASMLASSAAAAAPAPHALRWERAAGAESCIEPAALVAAVEQRIGRALGGEPGTAVRTIEGRVEPGADGFRVTLVVRDETGAAIGERTLEQAGECRRLDEPLVLVLSLIIDADASVLAPAPPTPPPSLVAPTPAVLRTVPSSTPWRSTISVSGLGAVGALHGISAAGVGSFELDAPGLPPIVASLAGWLPEEQAVAAGASRFTAISSGLLACPPIMGTGSTELRACAGAEILRVAASGMDFAENRNLVEWIPYARLEAELVRRLTARLGLVVGGGGWGALSRPRFVYDDGGQVREIYDTPAVAGVVRLGLRFAL